MIVFLGIIFIIGVATLFTLFVGLVNAALWILKKL